MKVVASPLAYFVDALCQWNSTATSLLFFTDQSCWGEIRGFAATKTWKLANFFDMIELRRLMLIVTSLPLGSLNGSVEVPQGTCSFNCAECSL